MKIFWSWQADTPSSIGRHFVRDALKDAIEQLRQAPEIEEPSERERREALHLDHDTQGTRGSPDLVRTILKKIDESAVVVADVTLVGSVRMATEENAAAAKKLINSNVAIELGYALARLTDENLVLVFNRQYGTYEELPFDLRHKGGAIDFNLPPNASVSDIDTERKKLKDAFVRKLKPYLASHPVTPAVLETPITFNRGAYFKKGEPLATAGTRGVDEIVFAYETEMFCYLRLIPHRKLELPLADLSGVAGEAPLLKDTGHNIHGERNAYGAIGFCPAQGPKTGSWRMEASTQLFRNGEVWSIGSSIFRTEPEQVGAGVELPCTAALLLEQTYFDKVHALLEFAKRRLHLDVPWTIECGLVGVSGLHVHVRLPGMDQFGPAEVIHDAEIVYRADLNENTPDAINKLLLGFFEKFYDAIGLRRPPTFFGFPPDRPSRR